MQQQSKRRMWPFILMFAIALCAYAYVRNKPRGAKSLSTQDVILEMKDRADRAVQDAKNEFNAVLDFSPDSIEALESVLARVHDSHKSQPLSSQELYKQALKWGGYIGEVIKRMRTAEWRLKSPGAGEVSLPIVYEDESESFPVGWCYKRIVNGEEDNVWHKFTILVINRDKQSDGEMLFTPDNTNDNTPTAEPDAVQTPKAN